MDDFSWNAAYYTDLQTLYALLVVPVAFLAFRAGSPVDLSRARVPEAGRFVAGLTLFFAVATMIDPISTGPIAKSEAIAGSFFATLIPFFFVVLGDLRVLLLAIGVARPDRSFKENFGWAMGMSLIVPVATGVCYSLLGSLVDDLHGLALWMIYEAGFLALSVALSRRWLGPALAGDPQSGEKTAFLRSVFGYSAAYYSLWLASDFVIVFGELDLGWALRMVPNQLYYAFWVPFVYFRFFSRSPDAA